MMQAVLGAWLLLLAAFPAAAAGPAADPHQSAGRAVFLDPAFGGKESGPILEGKIAGKRVTLDLAKEAYRALRSRGISVHLSRSRDVAVSADDRAVKARKTGGDLYVSLNVSRDSRNCVQLSVPAFPAPATGDGTDAYLMDLMWENLRKKSGDLAQIVSRNLKDRGVALCGEMSIQKDAALEKAMLPAVIVDWRTGGSTAARSAPADASLQKTIASALAEGIREYSALPDGGGLQR
jgi:N-acetylmuramoyl-L-alanine amidase